MIVQPVLVVAAALFSLGIYGILVRRNAVMVLLSIELILNSVNINFIMFDTMLADTLMQGQIFTIFIITIAAAEVLSLIHISEPRDGRISRMPSSA